MHSGWFDCPQPGVGPHMVAGVVYEPVRNGFWHIRGVVSSGAGATASSAWSHARIASRTAPGDTWQCISTRDGRAAMCARCRHVWGGAH